jgi:hypothetical protein
VLVTIEPSWLSPDVLHGISTVVALGRGAAGAMASFAREAGLRAPPARRCRPDEALLLSRGSPKTCRPVRLGSPRQNHERHKGKYALGDVGRERSFYFTDGNGMTLGAARNLAEFVALAGQAPDAVWDRHLHRGDFGAWFLDVIRDEELAQRAIELAEARAAAGRARPLIIAAIRERYVIPDRPAT